MASYVADVVTWNTTAGNKTATLTPAVNDLLVVVFGEAAQAVTGTITDDQGGTYTVVQENVYIAGGSYGAMAIRNSLVTAAVAHVVTMTAGGVNTGGGLGVIRVSGMSKVGATAEKQSSGQSNQGASTTPAPVFGAACLTSNLTIAAVINNVNPAALTEPSGWTERQDVGFGTPTRGLEYATRDSGFTGTTVTWGSISNGSFCSMILELDTSATADADAEVSWAETEVPDAPANADAEVSWAEMQVPDVPADAEMSWAEFEVPDVPPPPVGEMLHTRRRPRYRTPPLDV